jgi:hypothetical protein
MNEKALRGFVEGVLYNAGVEDDGEDTRLTNAVNQIIDSFKKYLANENDIETEEPE